MSIESTSFYREMQVENKQREAEKAGKRNEMGKDEFMRLLIAQLEHQDPLEPTDNGEFIAQMAQFSSLEGISNLDATVSGFADSMQSTQALQASTLVGRSVQVLSNVSELREGEVVNGTVDLKESSPDVFVAVYSDSGEYLGDISLGSREPGEVAFEWNGLDTDGEPFPPGAYQFRAFASNGNEHEGVDLYLAQNVASVSLNSGKRGEIMLNISGMSDAIPLRNVKVIN
ncbi:flagellar hook assembly protein FlgD [Marinospirillum insulare]|uniref:Basal-body rod modification protein FlgD n=1 Tax=Marinospirillum insulare TaxID=217169 RepID=A0ABQ5ZW90_9GAMM|nr:flagellar hook assembly protein FlgD [Marinospirillum insulare]GLR63313.1 basal-body rod modification protein FlgD [Marinospirillum insulare]